MEKFEKVLSLFIKNPYRNVELSKSFLHMFNKLRYAIFLILPCTLLFSTVATYPYTKKSLESSVFLIANIHSFLGVFLLLFIYLFIIKFFYELKYKTIIFKFFTIIYLYSFFLLLLGLPLSLLNIASVHSIIVYTYYMTFAILVLFYSIYYHKKWKQYILHNHYEKIKKRLKSNNYYFDIDDKLFQFNLNEDENDKPKLTKIAEIVIGFMMRFGFTLPILAVLASSGTGGNGMIYFAIYLMFFIIPEIMKMLSQATSQVAILKQIEKEENVTIYNGKVKN